MVETYTAQHSKRTVQSREITIRVPEGVIFSLPLAGPASRFLAWLLDAFCIMAAGKLIEAVIGLLGVVNADLSRAFSIVFYFVLTICYAMALEWYWNGQTIGKRIFGLRVIDIRGLQLQASQVIIRNLLRALDSLPLCYLLGGLVCLISRYGQRLGDLAANTIVIKPAKVPALHLEQILDANHYNSLRNYPHLVARLRQQISPKQADIALQAIERRDLFRPESRVDLFHMIAGHFKAQMKFPDEALEGISDEQYVRNVVDILFRR